MSKTAVLAPIDLTTVDDLSEIEILTIKHEDDLPSWLEREALAEFLHHYMKPYEDSVEDIQHALDYVFSTNQSRGGFILLAVHEETLAGALVTLHTGWEGFVPENLLLFVCVSSELRGQGLGKQIITRALNTAEGEVKLHVEYDNPATRLYERLGFDSDYAEMRYSE